MNLKIHYSKLLFYIFLIIFLNDVSSNTPPRTGNSDYSISTFAFMQQFAQTKLITNFPRDQITISLFTKTKFDESLKEVGSCLWSTGSSIADQETWLCDTHDIQYVMTTATGGSKTGVRIESGRWQLIVFKWSQKTGLYELFIDYEKVFEEFLNNTLTATLSKEQWVLIGQETDSVPPTRPWDLPFSPDALWDEIYIWNKDHSIDFVKSILEEGEDPNSENSLVGYWPFEEGEGYISYDKYTKQIPFYLGGGNSISPFNEANAPFWVVSGAPVMKNVFTTNYIPGTPTLITIPSYDEDGDELSFTIQQIPSDVTLFQDNEGEKGTKLKSSGQLTKDSFWVQTERSFNETIIIEYKVTDGVNQVVDGKINLSPNKIPLVWNYSVTGDEDLEILIYLYFIEQDNEPVTLSIVEIPKKGRLVHFGSKIEINEGDLISDPEGRVLFYSEENEFGSPYSSFVFSVFDGHFKVESEVTINVISVSDPPISISFLRQRDEDTGNEVIDFSGITDPDPYGTDHFVIMKYLKSLPELGKVYQYDFDTDTVGNEIKNVSGLPIEHPRQWGVELTNFSTQWPGGELWKASATIGKFDCVEKYCDAEFYGDCIYSWSPATSSGGIDGTGAEWLELKYQYPMYLKEVEVYENLATGAVYKIQTKKKGELFTIWEGEPNPNLPHVARVFSPRICQTDFLVDSIQIHINTSAVPGWNEVDAFAMIGSLSPDPRGLITGSHLLYVPPKDWNGEVEFKYGAYDCYGQESEGTIKIIYHPVNDGPRPNDLQQNSTVILNEKSSIFLYAHDIEGDNMTFIIKSLPSFGVLYDFDLNIIEKVPFNLPSNQLFYMAQNEKQLEISFQWEVVDIFSDSSGIQTYFIKVSCPPGYFLDLNQCVECSSGTISRRENSEECIECPSGYTSNKGSNVCFKNEEDISSTAKLIVRLISLLSVIYCVFIMIMLTYFKNKPPVRVASYISCMIITFGGLLVSISSILRTANGDHQCYLPPWFMAIGFCLALGSILLKNLRVYKVFENLSLMKVFNESENTLARNVFLLCVPNIIVLIFWMIFDLPTLKETKTGDKYVELCHSDSEWVWKGILYGLNGVLLFGCLVIAIATRNIKSHFSEAKIMAFSIYNVLLCTLVVVIISPLLDSNPSSQLIVTQLIVIVAVFSTLTTFFGYKFYRCVFNPKSTQTSTQKISTNPDMI